METMMTVPCQMIPRNNKRKNPSPSSQSLTSIMKKTKTTDDSKMLVFNLPPNTKLSEFIEEFMYRKVWEKHGERVDVVNYRVWRSSGSFASVLVEFRDPRQRNIALSINGVLFCGRTLRAEIFERREDGHAKNKKYLCRFFAGRKCKNTKERCPFAHGVLDLKLYNNTQLIKDRCMYINQIDSRYFGIDLLNLVEDKFNNEHRGEPQLIITALHYRQQMGDALIEFGSHKLKSMSYDLLNGLKWGSQTLAVHPWESRYKEIFIDYFDRNVHTEIKVKKGTPVFQAASLPKSEDVISEFDSPQAPDNQRMQVRTSGHNDPVATPAAALPRRISQEPPSQDIRNELFCPSQGSSQRTQAPTGHVDSTQMVDNDLQATSAGCENNNLDHPHNREDHDGSVSTSCTMETVTTDRPSVSVTMDHGHETRKSSTTRPVEDIVRNWWIAGNAKERADSWSSFQHEGTLDSKDLQTVPPLRPAGKLNRNQEDREPGALELQDTVVTDQQDVANMRAGSRESEVQQPDNCRQEGIAETMEEEPREPEPTESQQDENHAYMLEASSEVLQGSGLPGDYQPLETDNSSEEGQIEEDPREQGPTESQENENSPDMLEDSNEVMQGSEFRGEYQPLQETPHPAPTDDPEMDRMRREIAKLKSEQAEKDQLIEYLKQENANMETQLDASRTDARLHLAKLSEEQRKLAEAEEEVDRLRHEVTDDLRPKLKRKEEQTKQLKIEVYDLLKVRCDVFAQIKELCRAKSDQDNSVSGNDQVSEDHKTNEGISLNTILELKKHLEGVSTYVKEKEAENERLRDENSTLEEEMEQMRMCRAMEMGFVAGEGPDGDGA